MVVILCGSSSGSKILLGEGGDVELGARTSKQISVFAIGLLASFTYFIFIAIFTCFIYLLSIYSYIVDQYSHNKIALRTSNSYLEESRGRSLEPFTGYSASNFTLSDRCIISF